MKKSILLFVLIPLLFSCSKTKTAGKSNASEYPKGFGYKDVKNHVTIEDVEEDCEYLQFLVPQAYINYETEKSEYNFDINQAVDEIKKLTTAKENKADKTIDVREFLQNIHQVLKKNMHVIDAHMLVHAEGAGGGYFFAPYKLYASSVYFEQKSDDFYVAQSDLENVKKGMKYTGNPANLYEWYFPSDLKTAEQKVYRFCIFTDKKITGGNISIDGENYSVTFAQKMPDFETDFDIKKKENSIYIKIPDFNFFILDENDRNICEAFENVITQIKKMSPDKDIIVDLRNNTGGQLYNAMHLLSAILFKDNDEAENKLGNYEMDSVSYDSLDSSVIRNAEKSVTEENPEYEILKADVVHSAVSSEEKPDLSKDTVFTGKIYFIINGYTASAPEFLINMTYDFLPAERITIIGTPSMGLLENGGIYEYYLPNSGIMLGLSSKKIHTNENLNYQGDTKGIFPHIWAEDEQIEEILKDLK